MSDLQRHAVLAGLVLYLIVRIELPIDVVITFLIGWAKFTAFVPKSFKIEKPPESE